jgi:hypothetical protein
MALASKPRQPVITLESLGAIEHASQSGKKQVSKENEPNEQSLLPVHGDGPIFEDVFSYDESSTASYHGSPKEDGDNFHSIAHESSSDNA